MVKAEMERAGRNADELVVSMLWAFLPALGKEELIDTLGEYERAGLHHVIGVPLLRPSGPTISSTHDLLQATLEDLHLLASEVFPAFG